MRLFYFLKAQTQACQDSATIFAISNNRIEELNREIKLWERRVRLQTYLKNKQQLDQMVLDPITAHKEIEKISWRKQTNIRRLLGKKGVI